jgi:pyruvate decarboxylase
LLEAIDPKKLPKVKKLDFPQQPTPSDADSKLITQSFIWKRIGSFLRPGDLLFMDTGTSQFGILDAEFPDVTYNMQGYFASLGHSLPMMLGGAMANRVMGGKGRVVLVVGDGALQLTVQEMGTIVKEKLDVIM